MTLTLAEPDQVTDALEGFSPTICTVHADDDHDTGPDCYGWKRSDVDILHDGHDALTQAWRDAIDHFYPAGSLED